jgi:EpsI family protein
MRSSRTAFVIAALMVAASIGAVVARPDIRTASRGPAFSLEDMVPKHIGDWREEPQLIVQVVNPQIQEVLDKTYNQVLARSYVNAEGYRIMLSVAYGSDQRGPWRAHEPEMCYAGQGFTLQSRQNSQLATPFGEIPVRRLLMSKGPRVEPLTYWVRIGNKAVQGWQWKLVELGYVVTGRVPDGLIFRVSSIDRDQARANRFQDQFINQLLQAMPPTERTRLSGLGNS